MRSGGRAGSHLNRCGRSRRGWSDTRESSGSATTDSTSTSASYRRPRRSRMMAVQQLGNETTTVYADGAEFVMERIFDAPRETVWRALTEADRIPRWWGPRKDTMTVEQMDVRVGGKWRWVAHTSD